MKVYQFKKVYILVVFFLFIGTILLVSSISSERNPIVPLANIRDYVKDYEVITTNETKNGTMVLSVGKVNKGEDNMYFVDMVTKTFMAYKWLGGGGHVDRDLTTQNKNFILSAQLINEKENIIPTFFGIFYNDNISKVSVDTVNGRRDATIHNAPDKGEKIYIIQFDNSVSHYRNFVLEITLKNGDKLKYVISDDKLSDFQAGDPIYFYENKIQFYEK